MPKNTKQKFDLTVQRDQYGQYYVQRSFSDNIEMENWLQKFTNQTLQINNLKRDLEKANKQIEKLKTYEKLYNQVFYERVNETTRADNAEKVLNEFTNYLNIQLKSSDKLSVESILEILKELNNGK